MDDIAVDQHFPGVGRKVLCAKLGHLLLDQRPFLRRHRDAQHKLPFSVCHFRTSIHSGFWGLPQDTNGKPFAGSVATLPMLAVFVLLPLKSVLPPRKYPQNPGFSENRTKKERAQLASSQKQNRWLSCTLRFVILLLNLNGPVNRALDDRQKFFRAEFQLVADPLPLCAFLPHDLRVKIPFHGKPADFDKLYDNRQAGNRAVIFDVGKIAPVDIDLFRQRLTR